MARRPKLVTQFLENIHRQALEDHPELVKEFFRRRNGIYALFKKGELYYAGLASDLRWRLKHHLRDRHRDSWDAFSGYLTIGDNHLRELEALLIRVVRPPGNKQLGKFAGAENLSRKFEKALSNKQRLERLRLMGRPVEVSEEPKRSRRMVRLRGHYKKRLNKAKLRRDGTVAHGGKVYSSLSAAASAICGHPTNGRWFWHFERSPGDWVRMREKVK
jgi:hypothetical protein